MGLADSGGVGRPEMEVDGPLPLLTCLLWDEDDGEDGVMA